MAAPLPVRPGLGCGPSLLHAALALPPSRWFEVGAAGPGLAASGGDRMGRLVCRCKQVSPISRGASDKGGAAAAPAPAPAAAVPKAVEVRDLGLSVKGSKGEVTVLKGCTLSVPAGQLWMLLGPNGCGKSTLLKALAGLLRPSSGRMYVVGPKSFVFQNPDHQVVMPTAASDVAFGLGQSGFPREEVRARVLRSLEAVGMSDYAERPVSTLSGGQKQRVAIAGAIAEESRVLLLDELTTFLDERDQMGVLQAVRGIVGGPQAVTALWVTHRLEELEYADGAFYMEQGSIVCGGSIEEVKRFIQLRQDQFNQSNGFPSAP